jgi:DNA-binding HxlR family transcriptional regulator
LIREPAMALDRIFNWLLHPTDALSSIQSVTSSTIHSSRLLDCPLNGRFGVLGRKWTLSILRDIGFRGIGRFKDLNESIGQITPRILSIRLRQLEAEGLIEKIGDGSASTPIWQLSQKGRDLIPLLREWIAFRSKWDARQLFQDGQPRTLQELVW